jgi:hypothetical protein
MNKGRVGEERKRKETDGCPLTLETKFLDHNLDDHYSIPNIVDAAKYLLHGTVNLYRDYQEP